MKNSFPKKEKNLHITVGYHCNNFCIFCMESDRKNRERRIKQFLPKIYKILEENKHISKVIFTSGEPTLNPELINYIRYAKRLGFKEISIISNGRMLCYKDFCQDLIKAGTNEFIISIHGHTPQLHESLTRTPGSFTQTVQGLRNLSYLKKIFPIEIITSVVINKINYKFIKDILKFLQQFNLNEVVLNVVQPIGSNMEKFFFILMPRYKEVAYQLKEVVNTNPELLYPSTSKKRFVSVIDIPLCISEELIPFTGFGEIRILEKNNQMIEMDNLIYKVKRGKCKSCKYFTVCDGVYKNYIKHFGWEEFLPISD